MFEVDCSQFSFKIRLMIVFYVLTGKVIGYRPTSKKPYVDVVDSN